MKVEQVQLCRVVCDAVDVAPVNCASAEKQRSVEISIREYVCRVSGWTNQWSIKRSVSASRTRFDSSTAVDMPIKATEQRLLNFHGCCGRKCHDTCSTGSTASEQSHLCQGTDITWR
jgi:hypothetical protein